MNRQTACLSLIYPWIDWTLYREDFKTKTHQKASLTDLKGIENDDDDENAFCYAEER